MQINIHVAAQDYLKREARQRWKRLVSQAERANGERLGNVKGAQQKLAKVLQQMDEINHQEAKQFAFSIGCKLDATTRPLSVAHQLSN